MESFQTNLLEVMVATANNRGLADATGRPLAGKVAWGLCRHTVGKRHLSGACGAGHVEGKEKLALSHTGEEDGF